MKMNKPTPEELQEIYDAIKTINIKRVETYGRNAGKGPFVTIGEKCFMTQEQVKNILRNRVANWKPQHYKVYNLAKRFVKNC
jgi:hypothetical protein